MTLDQIDDFYRAHGYIRMSEPLPGEETIYLDYHRAGVRLIENHMASNARFWGVRGRSKNALRLLHLGLKEPAWGVEIAD